MFRVTEIKDILNISHTTIHKKLRQLKKELQGQVIKRKNITFITEKGLEILKKNINKSNNINVSKQLQQPFSNPFQEELIITLKDQIDYLKKELSNIIENQKEEKKRTDTMIMSLTQELKNIRLIEQKKKHTKKDLTFWQKFRNFLATPIEDLIRV